MDQRLTGTPSPPVVDAFGILFIAMVISMSEAGVEGGRILSNWVDGCGWGEEVVRRARNLSLKVAVLASSCSAAVGRGWALFQRPSGPAVSKRVFP